MTPRELAALLGRLRASQETGAAFALADEIRDSLHRATWLDKRTFANIESTFRDRAVPFRIEWKPAALGVGETYLLVHDVQDGRAHVGRLRVTDRPLTWSRLPDPALHEARRAMRGLLTVVAKACRRLPFHPDELDFEHSLPGDPQIDGPSLGLAACVAMLSRALGQVPSPLVAGTAAVRNDGTLAIVGNVPAKTRALADQWPQARRLLVAAEQERDFTAAVDIVECVTLEDAFIAFELDLGGLASSHLEDHVSRVGDFERQNRLAHSSDEWRRLSLAAWASAQALRDADPETARKACSWSALFALHSGDAECATDILRRLDPPVSIATAPDLWHAIIRASAAIDIDPAAAVGAARDALNACDALGDQGRDLLGYALGTYGRALLHVSRAIDALEPLSAAVEHHARNLPREEARSRVYYATALRRAGRPEDALEVAKEGLRLVRNVYPDWAVSQTTSLFLHLEIGRVLLALGRPDEAMAAFDVARAGQRRDHDYPRLSAIRGIAEAARRLGDSRREREAVESILRVAGETTGTIQRVAAIGVGEALLRGPLDGGPTQRELVDTWSRIFELAPDPGSVARLAECLVY